MLDFLLGYLFRKGEKWPFNSLSPSSKNKIQPLLHEFVNASLKLSFSLKDRQPLPAGMLWGSGDLWHVSGTWCTDLLGVGFQSMVLGREPWALGWGLWSPHPWGQGWSLLISATGLSNWASAWHSAGIQTYLVNWMVVKGKDLGAAERTKLPLATLTNWPSCHMCIVYTHVHCGHVRWVIEWWQDKTTQEELNIWSFHCGYQTLNCNR